MLISSDQAPRFLEATAGEQSSSTLSPSGCVVSTIFDAFSVEWNNGGTDPDEMPGVELVLTATAASRGQEVKAGLRGLSSPPGGRIRLEGAGRIVELGAEEEQFLLETSFLLDTAADETRLRLTLDLRRPEDGCTAAMLTLDSIDLHMPACEAARPKG